MLLIGELGAGKTVFAQGFASGLGYEGPVTSPTFVLVQQYEGRLTMFHSDMYRLGSLSEVADLGLVEIGVEGVLVIEWGDFARPVVGSDFLEVVIDLDGEGRRMLAFTPVGESWERRATLLAQAVGS